MAKNKVSEWSATPADNTDVGGIDINEGCAPSGINNAIRDVMAQIKDMQTGADGDNFVVGGNLTVTGTVTLSTDLPVAQGGTGASTAADARTNLGLGSIATQASSSVTITGGSITGITDLTVADGGTGASSITANSVILGNGTSALSGNLVAPGTSGNVLTSNGTTWTSSSPQGLGDGQTWTNVVGSRSYGTTYTNSTGRSIYITVSGTSTSSAGGGIQLYVNGSLFCQEGSTQNDDEASYHTVTCVIPNGNTYSVNAIPGGGGQGGSALQQWWELR